MTATAATLAQNLANARNASIEAHAGREYLTPEFASLVLATAVLAVERAEYMARRAGLNPDALVAWGAGSNEWKATPYAPNLPTITYN